MLGHDMELDPADQRAMASRTLGQTGVVLAGIIWGLLPIRPRDTAGGPKPLKGILEPRARPLVWNGQEINVSRTGLILIRF